MVRNYAMNDFFPHRSNRGNYIARHPTKPGQIRRMKSLHRIYSNLKIAIYRLVIPITGSDKDLVDSPELLILAKGQQNITS